MNETMKHRAFHRPVSMHVETIKHLPDVRELPHETLMTINLRFDTDGAIDMILFLMHELKLDHHNLQMVKKLLREIPSEKQVAFIIATVTGPSR